MPVYHTKAAFLFSKIPPLFGQKKVFENDRDMVYYQQGNEKNRRAQMPKNGPCAAEMIKHPTRRLHHRVGRMRFDPFEDTERSEKMRSTDARMCRMRFDPFEDTEREAFRSPVSTGTCRMRFDPFEDTESGGCRTTKQQLLLVA